jgi:hypothetical protein
VTNGRVYELDCLLQEIDSGEDTLHGEDGLDLSW